MGSRALLGRSTSMPPKMKPVYSSHVDKIGHDSDTQELHVQWKGGKISIYSGVSETLADEISKSWSVGKAISDQIKDNFPHRYSSG
jgi:KTSC domain